MTKDKDAANRIEESDSQGRIFRADTVPPPASGDAYSAETVVRQASPEMLAAIREQRKSQDGLGIPRTPKVPPSEPLKAPRDEALPAHSLLKPAPLPRFNFDEDDDSAVAPVWEAPPVIADHVRAQRASVRPSADPETIEDDTDSQENAMTMLSVSPASPSYNRVEPVATHTPAVETHAPADVPWPVPLAPPRQWRKDTLLLVAIVAIAALVGLVAGLWFALS